MINIGWLEKCLIAMIIFVIFYLSANSIGRQFNTKPESIMAYYLIGSSMGIVIWLITSGQAEILKIAKPLIVIGLLGLILGTIANIYLIQAVIEANNPGLPSTIIGLCGVFVYIIGSLLAVILPKYFGHIKFDWLHLVGVLLIFAGIGIISIKQ